MSVPGAPFSIYEAIAQHRGPMKPKDLAGILGCSTDVVYAMVRTGKIPPIRLPGSNLVRFDPASLCFWLRKHNPILHQVAKAS